MNFKKLTAIVGGSIAGVVLAISLSTLLEERIQLPPNAKLVSDSDGALSEVCIHYTRQFHDACIDTLKDFFSAMHEDVSICIVVEKQEEFDFLKANLADIPHGPLKAVVTGHPITPWAKDRFGTLITDDGESVLAVPPAKSPVAGPRGNDGKVPDFLAAQFNHIQTRRMPFFFEGGDLLCDSNVAYIAATCLARNQPFNVDNRAALIRRISDGLGKEVVVIGESHDEVPDHHIGMYLTPLGDNVVAVADPDLGYELYTKFSSAGTVPFEKDTTKFEPFRNVIRIMEKKGFKVVLVPMLMTTSPRVYITYNNAILETRNGEKRIYMPTYNVPLLGEYAKRIFKEQGWKVIPVNVRKVYGYTGSLRCLVGIIGRK